MRRMISRILWLVLMCAPLAQAQDSDPWEATNRQVQSFNDRVDAAVLKPIAQGYRAVTPGWTRAGIGNVFSNLGEVSNFANALLQGKPDRAATALGRFVFNSTLGLYGWFDVMDGFGLSEQPEDFGQTLAVWGVPSGPYVVLPLLGPATVRDGATRLTADRYLDPLQTLNPTGDRDKVQILSVVDTRESFLDVEGLILGDRYTALRNAYLDRRAFLVDDGQAAGADDFLDDF